MPGYFGYEAGQCCVGDHFAWFTDNCVPESYEQEAKASLLESEKDEEKTLQPDQKKAMQKLLHATQVVSLLHGVTGSGKTEDFLQHAK